MHDSNTVRAMMALVTVAWAGPPLSLGMPVPQKKGAFCLRALLYCAPIPALSHVYRGSLWIVQQ